MASPTPTSQQRTLIVSIDLGTSATTASHIIVNDSFTPEGKLRRQRGRVNITNIRDWPGGSNGDATGNVCVPTDLIYTKEDRKLFLWGFRAQQYLDDPYPEIHPDTVFVVEHIKLLLQDPDSAIISTPASRRYRALRDRLTTTLGKQPEEVFEDFLNEVIAHIIGSANRKYFNGISGFKVELVLAFPSGWRDSIHTRVAGIGARAMAKAIAANDLRDMVFGIENVYTVSETLCGVKEWLRDTIAEAITSIDMNVQGTNLDELNEGDCFLPIDIGGGTGCMTPLRLVTKEPLRVDQLGPTQSLEVSGEAVQAEFEAWLRPQITSDDYPGDIPRLLYQICRKFKEEKKDCGLPPRPGSTTWNVPAPRLRPNPNKGFGKGHMKIERSLLEKCFDPVIDVLETAIDEMLRRVGDIKAIVFLGQFGSSSEYLRKRMARSHISGLVKLRHSESGKLNVVRGAISERLFLSEGFVRKSQTLKSYGTLVTLPYYPESEAAIMFPGARKLGAVPFERDADGLRLKVVEWAIPKGTILEDGQLCDIGKDGRRHHHTLHHTWPHSHEDIKFEDMIVVSDEVPPPPQLDGKSYTLWTAAHEHNQLVHNGRKVHVQQIPFSWDLSMSQKLDANGNPLGAYEKEELETFWYPEEYKKGRRRVRLRILNYELIWNITEMQVKVYIRALFPNPPGPLTTQLAKERAFEADETAYTGESRSRALERDIEISRAAISRPREEEPLPQGESDVQWGLTDLPEHARANLVDEPAGQDQSQQQSSTERPQTTSSARIILHLGPRNTNDSVNGSASKLPNLPQQSSSDSPKPDGRRRDGCYTCKLRKKKCDCKYTFNETTGATSCNACVRCRIDCHMTQPMWDDAQLKAQLLEWKGQTRLGKRKVREEPDLSDTVPPDRPTTVNPAELSLNMGSHHHNIAPTAPMGQ